MPFLATSQQVQRVEALAAQPEIQRPEQIFTTDDCINHRYPVCSSLFSHGKKCHDPDRRGWDCPFETQIADAVIPAYQYKRAFQLPGKERDIELFKIALADVNPMVKLVQKGGRPRGKAFGWNRTRAYLGAEGLRQEVDCWKFANYRHSDWLDIQSRLIRHDAIGKMRFGSSFGSRMCWVFQDYLVWSENLNPSEILGNEQVQQWSRDFDECLSSVLNELSGSLPDCSLFWEQGASNASTPPSQPIQPPLPLKCGCVLFPGETRDTVLEMAGWECPYH